MKRRVTKKPTIETMPEIHNDFTARRPFSDSGPNFLMVERARETERTPMGMGRLQKIKGASQDDKVCRPESAAPMSAMSATGKVR